MQFIHKKDKAGVRQFVDADFTTDGAYALTILLAVHLLISRGIGDFVFL
jgi:hypothetical protein